VAVRALPANTGRAPVSARGARTRKALVEAARRVFERDGYLDARITDIATEAGVAAGSFYTYFTGKEDAFAAVIEDLSEEMLHPPLHRAVGERDDPVAAIAAANKAYLTAYRRNARLMGLLEQVSQVDDDFRRLRLRRARAFADRNAHALKCLQDRGLADPGLDPDLAAQALGAMVSRMAYFRYVQGFGTATPEALANTLTRLWVNALGIEAAKSANRRRRFR
jgi:AcrR family transcriptional regulator